MNETLELLRALDRQPAGTDESTRRELRTETADVIEVSRFLDRLEAARARREERTS